jgi:MoaA/NifB/PqqE/SkfB family radical SAM enzyme
MIKTIAVYIYPSLECNANCLFCYIWKDNFNIKTEYQKKYSFEWWERIFFHDFFSYLKDFDANIQIKFLWWEPLLHQKFIISCLDYLCESDDFFNKVEYLSINTNGILLNQFINKLVLNSNYDKFKDKLLFICSLHWFWKIHDKLTSVPWSFKKIFSWMLRLQELWLKILITYVVTNINLDHTFLFIDLYWKYFWFDNQINLTFFDASWNGNKNKNFLSIDFTNHNIFEKVKLLINNTSEKYKNVEIAGILPLCIIPPEKRHEKDPYPFYIWSWLATQKLMWFSDDEINEFEKTMDKINPWYIVYKHENYNYSDNINIKNIIDDCKNCSIKSDCWIYNKWWYRELTDRTHGINSWWTDFVQIYLRKGWITPSNK